MSTPRRTIEHLIEQSILPIAQANAAATHLEVFPTKRSWLAFFDKSSLIIGMVALVLSLVFFIAYNWLHMGKIGKFALVESALVITIALYIILSFKQKFQPVQQWLLFITSIITGVLLALFGQVYQTGADTWQLFFNWALFIIPWVLIARLPVLWLLWLGLVNASLILYLDVADFLFIDANYQSMLQVGALALINFVALNAWLLSIKNTAELQTDSAHSEFANITNSKTANSENFYSKIVHSKIRLPTASGLHWSVYIVGLLSSYFITHLAIINVFDNLIFGNSTFNNTDIFITLSTILIWLGWCGFMLWRFYKRHIDLLMLTYVCGSVIAVVMFWAGKLLLKDWEAGGMLILALLLIAMSSIAVVWLRRIAHVDNINSEAELTARTRDNDEKSNPNSNPNQILAQLQQLGLISPSSTIQTVDSMNEPDNHDSTPWFIHLFFGFSGILASIFLVGFLTLILYQADIFDRPNLQWIVGIVLSMIAFALFKHRKSRNNTFWNSLAFALSGAGQLYFAFSIFGSEMDTPLDVWLFLLLQIIMTMLIPNFIYRLLSSMAALGSVVYLLSFYQLPELSLGLLALVTIVVNLQGYALLNIVPAKLRFTAFSISKALNYSSAIMLLCVSVYFIAAEYGNSFISSEATFRYHYILAQGLLILASLYGGYLILKRYPVHLAAKSSVLIGGIIIIMGIISVYVSGLLATSLIIIIAFANSQRVLLGLGVLALVSYIFWYYYQLDTSLLVKSGSMLIIGLTVLMMRWILMRQTNHKAAIL
ncbi:DUF2157 domain-containing protein [Psychrobacter urativorans]|uniref:DUF4401 domain-containing protein n=1 Tax=Psychrobacter urativorans TaxID=45610 RepID=A0A0M4TF03_9GAMM|nr:DUF2157 domain-containing protein [Psychrobacter urativorans]ALF59729.1 hypothetical protein AOC03_06520 [Psychrobacter urativorans]